MGADMAEHPEMNTFWQAYINSLPEGAPLPAERYPDWYFGDNSELADELGDLVLEGKKTATCTLLLDMQSLGESIPQVGQRFIITRFDGFPLGVIETTAVEILPFDQVTADFAYAEGEGDRTYESWRAGHERFFSRRCALHGQTFTPDMTVVCERFQLVYPAI
jgi:uncharacterized protein YhfF